MQCDTCGLLLDSVDESQVERRSRWKNPILYCEAHKPIDFILA